jgi:hypothetical protein
MEDDPIPICGYFPSEEEARAAGEQALREMAGELDVVKALRYFDGDTDVRPLLDRAATELERLRAERNSVLERAAAHLDKCAAMLIAEGDLRECIAIERRAKAIRSLKTSQA